MAEAIAGDAPTGSSWRWPDFRLIPAFEQESRIVAAAETPIGRLLLFAAMLVLAGTPALMAIVALGCAVAYLPRLRAALLILATISVGLFGPMLNGGPVPTYRTAVGIGILFTFIAMLLSVARRVGRRGPLARPVPSLFLAIAGISTIASLPSLGATPRAILWSALASFAGAMWFIAYAVTNVTSRQPKQTSRHLGVLHPFWGSTCVPYGKGAAYLAKFESGSRTELAITQIKAIKLLLWAKMLALAGQGFNTVVHVRWGVPKLENAVAALAAGRPFPWALSLASIPINFIDNLLSLAVMGHIIVACCRFAGFRIPRNTYRPFEARSIADFWNRYYYYFKELLVDFFFLPAFSRLQGWPTRIRVIAATFFAAGVGNYLYHFFRDIDYVRTLGPLKALTGSQTSVFYCLLLSLGIAASQLTEKPPAAPPSFSFKRVCTIGRVVSFYCFVSIFAYEGRTLTLADHFRFVLYAFGIA